MARELGLPIARVELATNENRAIPDLFASWRYEPRPSTPTCANAMDVGAPSNVERLLAWWPRVNETRDFLGASSVDERMIIRATAAAERDHGLAICPHTACGYDAALRLRRIGVSGPIVVGATAHPAKFESIVERILGRPVEAPPALSAMLARPSSATPLAVNEAALASVLSGTAAS
jgi:threonine synthase